MIEVKKVARPGSLKAIPYPFADMKEIDMDTFTVDCTDLKGVARVRNHVGNTLRKWIAAGNTSLALRSEIIKEDGKIVGVGFWASEPKKSK